MKTIGVISGGFSSEYDISVKSARMIVDNFPKTYQVHQILMDKSGWNVLVDNKPIPLNPINFTFEIDNEKIKIDAVIVYIHGDPGENGKIQAYLEMIDIPYVNSGTLASQLSFDKWYCNQFLNNFSIPVAKSIYLDNPENIPTEKEIVEQLGLPLFVKPCDSGSSYGISKVNKTEELNKSIAEAFFEGDSVVIESFLDGTEVTCAAYRTLDGIKTLPLTEIVTQNDFFDFEAKYKGESEEITPARISKELTEKVQEMTRKIYQLLKLRSIARVDFMLVGNVPYVIEVNTTPGFSKESLVPQMIACEGISIESFWSEILAVELD